MTWFTWFLLSFWALNALATISLVGKKREPVTPAVAVGVVVVNGLLVAGLLTVGT